MTALHPIDFYKSQLRITKREAYVYELLLTIGPMVAIDIAKNLNVRINGVYRLVNHLTAQGFVTVQQGWPGKYEAVPLRIALKNLEQTVKHEQFCLQSELLGLTGEIGGRASHEVSLLSGREALYSRYIVEARNAQSEILVFALGIAYDDQLHIEQQAVRARGVEVRHIVQQYTKDNFHIVKKWQRIGVKLRHHPHQSGFHLMVFDGRTVMMSLSDPTDNLQRTTMILNGPAVAAAMRDYFYILWAKSSLISN